MHIAPTDQYREKSADNGKSLRTQNIFGYASSIRALQYFPNLAIKHFYPSGPIYHLIEAPNS